MISTPSRSFRSALAPAPRRGFSLIEVAIALVIFVIGALAIIRIFPGALNVINNNGDQQIASNLNRGSSTKLKSAQTIAATTSTSRVDFNAVPDAVFNNSNADGSLSYTTWLTGNQGPNADHTADFRDSASSVIGIPRFNETLPSTQDIETGKGNSALSRYRAIVGERTKLESFNEGTDDAPIINYYALTQFPISVQPQGNAAVIRPIPPTISQDYQLENVRIAPNGDLDFSRATVDDGSDSAQPLPVNAGSLIYVTYRYIAVGTPDKYWGISEEAVPIESAVANLRGAAVKVQPPVSGRGAVRVIPATPIPTSVVPAIVKVRLRQFIGQGTFGASATPTALEQTADARRGLVRVLEQLLTTQSVAKGSVYPTIVISKPLVLDYPADWSFLLQSATPLTQPSAALPADLLLADQTTSIAPTNIVKNYRQITLGAPYIEDQAPVGVYSLLLDGGGGSIPRVYRSGYGTVNPAPPAANRLILPNDPKAREDEIRSGRATFIVERSDARARVAFQTRDKWVQQLAMAARSYKPFVELPLTATGELNRRIEPWRDYVLGNDNYIYFHAGEAGKTVNLTYSYSNFDILNGDVLPDVRVEDKPFAIETRLISANGLGLPTQFVANDGLVARMRLVNAQGKELPSAIDTGGGPRTINLTSIEAVSGVTVALRTAYINGNKYAQNLLTSNRGNN